jgi:polyphosphate kinase
MTFIDIDNLDPKADRKDRNHHAGRKKHQHAGGEQRRRLGQHDLYINREISNVAFFRRVLEEAQSLRHPLLERVKFLSFVSSQVDEFIMVRVAGLLDQVAAQATATGPDGMLPSQELDALYPLMAALLRDQMEMYQADIRPALLEAGIEILDYADLNRHQRDAALRYLEDDVLPVLTPLGVDPGHPFPHISTRSLNLAVVLRDPKAGELFARVKVPATLRSLAPLPVAHGDRAGSGRHGGPRPAFIWLDQVIAAHLELLFPGVEVVASYPFRVLRDADVEIQSDEAGDLLDTVEQGVRQRRFGSAVMLHIQEGMPQAVRDLLLENLEIEPRAVLEQNGPLTLGDLVELMDVDRPDLKDVPLVARVPAEIRRAPDLFTAIRRGDLLLHHPYDTFSTVAEFIQTAATDPNVLAIKQTLYRVGRNSAIVNALLDANERGKQVAVLVELKARFDEENNIEWARMLERAGVHVVYGQVELKTHAKVALVVRREATGLQRYVHLGTGNYNATTARVYEDLALLTCRPEITRDVSQLFNALTGYARNLTYQDLLVAPTTLRAGLLSRIEREIEAHKATGHGRLIFKTNALVDMEFIRALYRASQVGVQVDLIVRGMCCLRPGVEGVSENIRVVSLVGRYLEHSRIFYFAHDGAGGEVLVGSADLMPRNLDHRVEVVFPIVDPAQRAFITDDLLPAYLRDTANARRLRPDGTYTHLAPPEGEPPFDVQQWLAQTPTMPPQLLDIEAIGEAASPALL